MLTLHSVEVSSSPNSPPLFVIVFWGETNNLLGLDPFNTVLSLRFYLYPRINKDEINKQTNK